MKRMLKHQYTLNSAYILATWELVTQNQWTFLSPVLSLTLCKTELNVTEDTFPALFIGMTELSACTCQSRKIPEKTQELFCYWSQR